MAVVQTPTPWRWTRDQFVQVADAGYFGTEAHVELVDGEVFSKLGRGNAHVFAVRVAARALRAAFGKGFDVSQQVSLPLGERDQPEPDLSVVRGSAEQYDGVDPGPEDVALLVEVSDTTLAYDRGRKQAAYARAGIREYWIVNLPDRRLEIYRRPLPELASYGDVTLVAEGDAVSPLLATGAPVAVADLLPRNRALEP